jgi:hypothetical protein
MAVMIMMVVFAERPLQQDVHVLIAAIDPCCCGGRVVVLALVAALALAVVVVVVAVGCCFLALAVRVVVGPALSCAGESGA